MSTTVKYKNETIATVDNATKVLKTLGTWLEDDLTLIDSSSGGGGGSGYTLTEICPSTTFSVASAGGYTALTNSGRLVDGATYIITYDSTEYTCTAEELYGTDRFIGDLPLSWGNTSSDYIFPFCVEDWNGNNEPVVYARDTSSHTIKIERLDLNGASSSNVVTGTFTGTTTGAAVDISLNYTGNGYPFVCIVYPQEGAYNTSGTYYSLVQRYSILYWLGIKNNTTAPTYESSGAQNQVTRYCRYKSSSSNSTSTTGVAENTTVMYSGGNAQANVASVVQFKDNTTMSVFIASSSYGFAANIAYNYLILYSS